MPRSTVPKTRSRARQARLEFTPLPSSSPSRQSQPQSVRERAAAVTLSPDSRISKKRKTTNTFLPTPSSSWQQSGPNASSRNNEPSSSQSTSRRSTVPPSSSKKPPAHVEVLDLFSDSESDGDAQVPSTVKGPAEVIPVESNSSSGEDIDRPTTPRKKAPATDTSDDMQNDDMPANSDDESDDLPVRRKRLIKGPQTPRKRSREEDNDLKEDLEFLEPISPETPRQQRIRSSASKNAKQSALEALRLKRASKSHNGRQVHVIDSDSNEGDGVSDPDEYEIVPNVAAHDDEDQDDYNFVEEDDTGDPVSAVPFELKLRTMKPKQLFKIAVEWMVQKRINPGFEAEDEVYYIAFQRLNDYVTGMGGSKFQSSVWVPRFLRSLKARPVLEENHFSGADLLHDRCDACNRSNHPATYEVCFQGPLYNKYSLDELSDDEDEESYRETEMPSSDTKYYVGKFCMRNARTAHTFEHWKYHLNDWVVDYLKQEDHLTSDKIVERDGWSTKRKRDYANSLVDTMDEDGEIQALYRDFKNEIEVAQNAQNSYTRHNHVM